MIYNLYKSSIDEIKTKKIIFQKDNSNKTVKFMMNDIHGVLIDNINQVIIRVFNNNKLYLAKAKITGDNAYIGLIEVENNMVVSQKYYSHTFKEREKLFCCSCDELVVDYDNPKIKSNRF